MKISILNMFFDSCSAAILLLVKNSKRGGNVNKVRLFILLFLTYNVNAQDTANISREIKMTIYQDLNLYGFSDRTYLDYIKRPLIYSTLSSKGLREFIFLKITEQILAIDTNVNNNGEVIIREYKTPICLKNGEQCSYVVAYNLHTHKVFKLKGFKNNDFETLYYIITGRINYNKKTALEFVQKYWVEELDFKCLLESLKNKVEKSCLEEYSKVLKVY